MLIFLARFAKNDSGASAIEYAMLAALLAMGIIISITTLGANTKTPFSVIANKIQG
jgi:pilus assembly protein Flp/PilA